LPSCMALLRLALKSPMCLMDFGLRSGQWGRITLLRDGTRARFVAIFFLPRLETLTFHVASLLIRPAAGEIDVMEIGQGDAIREGVVNRRVM
jgi:hypothetical protein